LQNIEKYSIIGINNDHFDFYDFPHKSSDVLPLCTAALFVKHF